MSRLAGGRAPSGKWHRVAELFEGAISLPPDARRPFLENACTDDPALLEDLTTLLRSHEALSGTGSADPAGFEAPPGRRAPSPSFLRSLDPERAAELLNEDLGDLSPGDRVGRYHLIRELGRGGMGVVFLAHDPLLDRTVALKLLPRARVTDHALLDEARAASRLDHPGIGTVYELGTDDEGRRFIAMASYEGGSLRSRLGAGVLPVDAAVSLAIQMTSALGAAHLRGMVHGDVKPENLVFDARDQLKLVDFGVARTEPDGERGRRRGTLAYMSPERLAGSTADARSDLWAVGVILYEMLTGVRPSQGSTAEAVGARIQSGPPAPPSALRSDAPDELDEVVLRLLSPDPTRRFADAKAVVEALRAVADPPTPHAGPAARSSVAGRGAWVAAGSAVLLGAGALVLLSQGMPRVTSAEGWAGDTFPERGQVLLADVRVADDLDELALAVREALSVDLQQSSFVRVLGRGDVAAALTRMGREPRDAVQGAVALEVAERAGAGAVLEVTVARAGPSFVLSGHALDPASGNELFAVRTSAGSRRLLGGVEALSREIRRRLGEEADAIAESRPLPQVTTSSLDALRLYAEAERLVHVDNARAHNLLQAALELDPAFAMAHRLAGAVAVARLRFSEASRHTGLAWEHRDRLPERERWHVEALRASEGAFDPPAAVEALERILQRYPDDARALNNIGAVRLSWYNDLTGALDALTRAHALAPGQAATLINLVPLHFILGDVAASDSLARVAEEMGLREFLRQWAPAKAFALEDRVGAMAGCDELLAFLEDGGTSASDIDDLEVCGSMDVAMGNLDSATRRLEESQARSYRQGRARNVAHAGQALAVVELLRGDTVAARRRILDVLDRLPAEGFVEPDRFITRTNLRVQAALHGWDEVEERALAIYPVYLYPDHWFGLGGESLVRAAQAVAAGDGHRALDHLDQAFPPGIMPVGWRIWDELLRGLAHELNGELEAAARHLARAAEPGYQTKTALTKDRIHLPMALDAVDRVETARGNPAGAQAARQRLERLQGSAGSQPSAGSAVGDMTL